MTDNNKSPEEIYEERLGDLEPEDFAILNNPDQPQSEPNTEQPSVEPSMVGIDRFDMVEDHDGLDPFTHMKETKDGEYVLYEDALDRLQALQAENSKLELQILQLDSLAVASRDEVNLLKLELETERELVKARNEEIEAINTVEDGHGSIASRCSKCGCLPVVIRPGDIRCMNCDNMAFLELENEQLKEEIERLTNE